MKDDLIKCEKCGVENLKTNELCSNCGNCINKLGIENEFAVKPKKESKKIVLIILFLIPFLFMCFAGGNLLFLLVFAVLFAIYIIFYDSTFPLYLIYRFIFGFIFNIVVGIFMIFFFFMFFYTLFPMYYPN